MVVRLIWRPTKNKINDLLFMVIPSLMSGITPFLSTPHPGVPLPLFPASATASEPWQSCVINHGTTYQLYSCFGFPYLSTVDRQRDRQTSQRQAAATGNSDIMMWWRNENATIYSIEKHFQSHKLSLLQGSYTPSLNIALFGVIFCLYI